MCIYQPFKSYCIMNGQKVKLNQWMFGSKKTTLQRKQDKWLIHNLEKEMTKLCGLETASGHPFHFYNFLKDT